MSLDKYKFVMLDLETTGLEPSRHVLLEIGAIHFDLATLEVHSRFHAVIRPEGYLTRLSSFTEQMHKANGLLEDVAAHGVEVPTAEYQFTIWLEREVGAADKVVVLCGNSIHFDRGFVDTHFTSPRLHQLLSHRMLDVRSLMFTAEAWKGFRVHTEMAHRAMSDCEVSLETLRQIRALDAR